MGEPAPIPWVSPSPCRLWSAGMADPIKIVVMEGDQTGQELLEQAVRLLDPGVLGVELELQRFDLSLGHRRDDR